jgi:hypothetical protein
MGADICLESIHRPFEEKLIQQMNEGRFPPKDCPPHKQPEILYRALQSSGGYFRNGYNNGDVMWAMGLSWWNTVRPMLDEQGYLSIAKAKELVALIENRPFTKEVFGRHYLENIFGGTRHPVQTMFQSLEQAAEDTAVSLQSENRQFKEIYELVLEKRQALLDLLNKSIQLNEPLYCSV